MLLNASADRFEVAECGFQLDEMQLQKLASGIINIRHQGTAPALGSQISGGQCCRSGPVPLNGGHGCIADKFVPRALAAWHPAT
jgi:hypothetical protein